MRRIQFNEPNDKHWREWRSRCNRKQNKLIKDVARGRPVSIDRKLYSEMKVSVYMDYEKAFRGKCAFCERDIHNQWGDIDHYRPARRVRDADGSVVTRRKRGKIQQHPGYYWLVYEWRNLLPTCISCNQKCKKDHFPVRGFRAWLPANEQNEEPLLLNPEFDEPAQHMRFHRNGVLGWQTDRGNSTIVDILGLNDDNLPDQRRERYDSVRAMTAEFINHSRFDRNSPRGQELLTKLKEIKNGRGAFTSYALIAIEDECKEFARAVDEVDRSDDGT